jgi:GYF domain 2
VEASAAEDAMQWYYTVQGQRQGPVDDPDLEELVRREVIRDDTYVWREGLAEWQLYGAVKPKPAPVTAPRPVEPQSAERNLRTPSGIKPQTTQRVIPKPAAGGSTSYFFYYPVLRALGNGKGIRPCVVWGLKIGAAAAVVVGLLGTVEVLSAARGSGGRGMAAAVLMALMSLVTSLCVAQVAWYRAGSVAALGVSDYAVIPIAAILFRAAGECTATALVGTGAGACLSLWLSQQSSTFSLPLPIPLPVSAGFVGGIAVLLYAGFFAFLSLILGYLAAEWTGLLVDIADSIRKIRRVAEKAE